MEIVRSDEGLVYFKQELKNHSTCFTVREKNQEAYYAFEIINGDQAILYSTSLLLLEEVIEEFLFYSGFIRQIKSEQGVIYYEAPSKPYWKVDVKCIQPSQLYVSEEKYHRLLSWIQREEDIWIPVTRLADQFVALDGHTRLKVAQLLQFKEVKVYLEESDPYIEDFVQFCQQEQKYSIFDLPIIPKEQYQTLWKNFCRDYFNRHQAQLEGTED